MAGEKDDARACRTALQSPGHDEKTEEKPSPPEYSQATLRLLPGRRKLNAVE